jgi:outer membrane protein
MKRFIPLVMAALLFTAAQASAQEAKPAETKIGYVDLQRSLNDSAAGKEAKSELEADMKKKQAEIDKRVGERDKLKGELEKQSLVLSAEARRKRVDELEKIEKELERLISDANAEMQKRQRDKELVILRELKEIIDDIGKTEGYTVILPSDVILFSKDGTDLTASVIERYNASKAKGEKK